MKQLVLVFVVMFSSLSTWAETSSAVTVSPVVGTWCQRFDDFTTYLIIKPKKGQNLDFSARMMTIGNRVNEVAQDESGEISMGGLTHQVFLDDQNIGVKEIKAFSFLGAKYLRFIFNNGSRQTYKKCRVKITIGQMPVT